MIATCHAPAVAPHPLTLAMTGLARALERLDPETSRHCGRVAWHALRLARVLGLRRRERRVLAVGARLHDLGKLALAETVLHKPGALTPDEMAQVRAHPLLGCRLLHGVPALAPILPIVRSHHERWDGRGYPDGLAGTRIPFLARLVAVADSFDAMTSHRCYRAALPMPAALAQLAAGAGTQFDPHLAAAFVALLSPLAG